MNQFKAGVLDFAGVELIGQSFADEIFRVFHKAHPEFDLQVKNAEPEVLNMIQHVRGNQDAAPAAAARSPQAP
jgi:hypothetical protein